MEKRSKSNLTTIGKWGASIGELTSSSRRVYHQFCGTSTKKALLSDRMVVKLTEDVYKKYINGLPAGIGLEIKRHEKLLKDEVFDVIMPKYGELYVLYSMTRKKYSAIEIGKGIFLTEDFRGGMPVWEFLKWYTLKKDVRDNSVDEALAELSGIPVGSQDAVYKMLIKFFQRELEIKHAHKVRCEPPLAQQPVVTIICAVAQ